MSMTAAVRGGTASTKSARAVWVVSVLQLGYVVWFGVCVWVALARAAHFAGHLYIPYQGDPYTASADIWTGWSSWFITPMTMTVLLEPFIAVASIGVSVWFLGQERTRNNIMLFSVLLVSALLVMATLVLTIVPAGRSISGWILD